jgi:uncharacterized protein
MSPDLLNDLLIHLKQSLSTLYGCQLCGVYLFGSFARGDQDDQSDLDVMIVLENFDNYGGEIDRTSELISDLSLEFGLSISTVFLKWQDWLDANTPLLRNVRVDAVPV